MKQQKSIEELLTEMNKKPEKLIAISAIKGKEINIQIKILNDHGFTWKEIGKIVGLTADATRKRYERS